MLGSYVVYKANTYLVVRETAGKVLLLSPEQGKVQVSATNVEPTALRPAKQVTYRFSEYLVTGKGLIISLTSCKVMRWSSNDGNRRAILAL